MHHDKPRGSEDSGWLLFISHSSSGSLENEVFRDMFSLDLLKMLGKGMVFSWWFTMVNVVKHHQKKQDPTLDSIPMATRVFHQE